MLRAVLTSYTHERLLSVVVDLQYVLRGIGVPAVDEVAMHAVPITDGVTAGQLEGCGARPAVWESLAEVVAHREAELRDTLHAVGAVVVLTPCRIGVLVLQCLAAIAVGEAKLGLQVGGASLGGELRKVFFLLFVLLAPPLELVILVIGFGLGLGRDVTDEQTSVCWEGNLSIATVLVVRAETEHRHFDTLIVLGVKKGRDPFDVLAIDNARRMFEASSQ